MSSRDSIRADMRIRYAAVVIITANVMRIMAGSARPIRISRAATLTLANGTATIADRSSTPGNTAAVLSVTAYVIIDLEYPRLGLMQVSDSDKVLVDLRRRMN